MWIFGYFYQSNLIWLLQQEGRLQWVKEGTWFISSYLQIVIISTRPVIFRLLCMQFKDRKGEEEWKIDERIK